MEHDLHEGAGQVMKEGKNWSQCFHPWAQSTLLLFIRLGLGIFLGLEWTCLTRHTEAKLTLLGFFSVWSPESLAKATLWSLEVLSRLDCLRIPRGGSSANGAIEWERFLVAGWGIGGRGPAIV